MGEVNAYVSNPGQSASTQGVDTINVGSGAIGTGNEALRQIVVIGDPDNVGWRVATPGSTPTGDEYAITARVLHGGKANARLGTLNDAVTGNSVGTGGAAVHIEAGLVGTVVFEACADPGASYFAINAVSEADGSVVGSASSFPWRGYLLGGAGCTNLRARVSAYTSGSSVSYLNTFGAGIPQPDGTNITQGSLADAAVISDANGTVSAKLRGLVKILADVWDSTNHWLQVNSRNATVAVSTTAWTSATAQNTANTLTGLTGYGAVAVEFWETDSGSAVLNAGVLTFEGDAGSGQWFPIEGGRLGSHAVDTTYTVTGGKQLWQLDTTGLTQFRVRLSTVLGQGAGTGTATGNVRVQATAAETDPVITVAQPTAANLNATVSGTITANAGSGTFNIQSNAGVNTAQVNGSTVATAASGVQKVGIVGVAGTTLDGATPGVLDVNIKNVNNTASLATASVGANVVAFTAKRTGTTLMAPQYSTSHITTKTTTTPFAATVYVSTIVIGCSGAGTSWTMKIQDKSGTPLILVNAFTLTVPATGQPNITVNLPEPIIMSGGLDIITAGTTAGVVDVWITGWQ